MSVIEIKKQIIEKINSIENDTLLEDILRLIHIETENLDVYQLTGEQLNIVNEAREQVKKGDFLTEDEADKEIDTWLKE